VIPNEHQSDWNSITRDRLLEIFYQELPAAVLSRRENFAALIALAKAGRLRPQVDILLFVGIVLLQAGSEVQINDLQSTWPLFTKTL